MDEAGLANCGASLGLKGSSVALDGVVLGVERALLSGNGDPGSAEESSGCFGDLPSQPEERIANHGDPSWRPASRANSQTVFRKEIGDHAGT